MTLSYLKNMPIYFSSGKYKLSIHSFISTKYLAPNPMAGNIWCYRSKGWLVVDDRNMRFLLVLILTMCIKPFTFSNTICSVSFLNDISPFNIFLHTIHELHLKLDRTLLTDWHSANIHKWYSFSNAPIFHNFVAICL